MFGLTKQCYCKYFDVEMIGLKDNQDDLATLVFIPAA